MIKEIAGDRTGEIGKTQSDKYSCALGNQNGNYLVGIRQSIQTPYVKDVSFLIAAPAPIKTKHDVLEG